MQSFVPSFTQKTSVGLSVLHVVNTEELSTLGIQIVLLGIDSVFAYR